MKVAGAGAALAFAALAFAAAGPPPDLLRLSVRRGADPPTTLGAVLGDAPALVTFWATYCPPCRVEAAVLRRAVPRWRPRGVRIVGVAVGFADAAEAARAARDWGIDYEIVWVPREAEDDATRLVPAGLPATFFVHQQVLVRYDRLLHDADVDALVPKHLDVPPL